MKKEVSFLICGVLIGVLVSTCGFAWYVRVSQGGAAGRSDRVVLKLGHCLDTSHPVHKAMEFMKGRLEELSGRTVTIDIYPGGVIGTEIQCIEQLQSGDLAMTKTSTASIENFVPQMSVFGLPYLFRDNDHCWAVLNGPIGQELLEKGRDKHLLGLCYYDAGSRNFYTVDHPVRTPEDLDGLKIRVLNSRTAMDMVSCLGASPTPIAWGELYSALAQGTVDGAENNPPSFTTNKHYEICKHFTLDGHTRVPDLLMMGTKAWDRLGPQTQAWVRQAAEESAAFERELWIEQTRASLEEAKANGVTIYEVDQSLFAAKVQPMYDAIEDPELKDLVRRIRQEKP